MAVDKDAIFAYRESTHTIISVNAALESSESESESESVFISSTCIHVNVANNI